MSAPAKNLNAGLIAAKKAREIKAARTKKRLENLKNINRKRPAPSEEREEEQVRNHYIACNSRSRY